MARAYCVSVSIGRLMRVTSSSILCKRSRVTVTGVVSEVAACTQQLLPWLIAIYYCVKRCEVRERLSYRHSQHTRNELVRVLLFTVVLSLLVLSSTITKSSESSEMIPPPHDVQTFCQHEAPAALGFQPNLYQTNGMPTSAKFIREGGRGFFC